MDLLILTNHTIPSPVGGNFYGGVSQLGLQCLCSSLHLARHGGGVGDVLAVHVDEQLQW